MPDVVQVQLLRPFSEPVVLLGRWVGRVVAQQRILHHHLRDVDPEPIHPAVQPEAGVVEHRGTHRRVAPVEVRLLRQECVEVVLAGRWIQLPRRPVEHADPVVGHAAAGCRVAPHVPIPPRVVARGARLHEPRMLARRVVRHVVDEHAEVALVRRGHEGVEVIKRPEHRVDIGVVGDVVSEVGHRRRIERRDPDGVDAQPGQVVEPRGDPLQVTDPVAVRIGERTGVDLVDDGGLPPSGSRCLHARRLARCAAPRGLLLRSVRP